MKTLGNLKPSKGSNKNKKRLGRGIGSGFGKTAGKGHKGQLARSGGTVAPGFEGGSMPLYRRLPKRGFKSIFRKHYNIINLETLAKCNSTKFDLEGLKKQGLLKSPKLPVKILGKGKVEKAIEVSTHKISSAAQKMIEQAGGKVEIIPIHVKSEKK